ncbi:uncharacterized protein NPIL_479591 [Nephila pilipes]|uniref:Uncharacterized protein n=1 Tax=Nephila pilipes TaxID=299642 RepID=A0A8X6PPE0_NEPPI|nr:uncharacterized protein NPIL_479591 [Nephila pilipes]
MLAPAPIMRERKNVLQLPHTKSNPHYEYQARCERLLREFEDTRKILMEQDLQKMYPLNCEISNKDEEKLCYFCLGYDLFCKIYRPRSHHQFMESQDPLLNIVSHFTQNDIMILIKYLHRWFVLIGMENAIAKWLYALLSVLKKDLDEEEERFFETFRDECAERLEDCHSSEAMNLHLIYLIIHNYFCAGMYKIVRHFQALGSMNG